MQDIDKRYGIHGKWDWIENTLFCGSAGWTEVDFWPPRKINRVYICKESQEKMSGKYLTRSDSSERFSSTHFVQNKRSQPFGKQHTNFWSKCPASPLTEPHSAVFWRRIGQFLCYWHLDSRVWKSQNKTECCFHLDRQRVQMSEEENVSLLYNLNDLSSVVLNVAIKSQALFSVRLIGNSWNSERPAALNVFWHRRISSDTSFLWPDSSELRNESLNFNSLRSESFWPPQWSCTKIQSKAVSASQYKHRCKAHSCILQLLWPFAGANCQEVEAVLFLMYEY